jgi:hypothetical protein
MKYTILYLYTHTIDNDRTFNTLLLDARRAFFADPAHAQERIRRTVGDDIVCLCRFRSNGLQWRVTKGRKTLQRTQKDKNGYAIRCGTDTPVRTDYFSPEHQLTRVEYTSGADCIAAVELGADGSMVLLRPASEGSEMQREPLFPCPCVSHDSERRSRYIRVLGEPQALLYTTEGILCCYNAELARQADELKIQFAAEDSAPPAPAPQPEDGGAAETPDIAAKRRLACGRIQRGQFVLDETPVQGSLTFDDHSAYEGELVRNLPHGVGTMTDADGQIIYRGHWRTGKRHGTGTSYENGVQVYSGVWDANRYHGQGVLRLPDGSTLTGRFNMGTVVGPVTHRNAADQLLYEGRMENGLPHGSGARYRNGELVAEGTFCHGVLNGSGKLYSGGKLVYVGEIRDDVRWGVGASLENGGPAYFGQWEADEPHGAGMKYRNHQLEYVGTFCHGQPDGRCDLYRDGELYREVQFHRGAVEYMVEYENGHPVYAGRVKNDLRHGAGRLLDEYGQCTAQGIFRSGELHRKTRVIPRPLPSLDCPPELRKTPYEQAAHRKECHVLAQQWEGGTYAGQLTNGLPHGPGSLVFADHTFAGIFRNGTPDGPGTLTLSDGTVITGTFSPDGNEKITCRTVSYQVNREVPVTH